MLNIKLFTAFITSLVNYIVTGSVVSDLWEGLSTVITEVIDTMVSLFTGVVKIFYDSTAQTDKITVIGWLTLSAMGIGLFFLGLRFVRSLINRMKAR